MFVNTLCWPFLCVFFFLKKVICESRECEPSIAHTSVCFSDKEEKNDKHNEEKKWILMSSNFLCGL